MKNTDVKTPLRKTKTPNFSSSRRVRLKTDPGAPFSKRTRPDTPLLRWKFDDLRNHKSANGTEEEEKLSPATGRRRERRVVSVRKIAAGIWRLQLPEVVDNGGVVGGQWLEFCKSQVGHVGVSFHDQNHNKAHGPQADDLMQSPHSVSGPRNGFLSKLEPSYQFPNSVMEGATKWDPICWKTSDEAKQIYGHPKVIDQQMTAVSAISALEVELEQARARIHDLETEQRTSKKKLKHFLKKLSEERAAWRSREHEKIRAIIDDIKADLNRERKNRQRVEIVNSKLVNELADAKLSVKRYVHDYEKERKSRELIEEVCDELAKEIGDDKAEVEALKRESMKFLEEVEDERRMLQMAEVWREERVQMKLVDAKVTVEEKYSLMNKLVAELETFLSSRRATLDTEERKKAELLQQVVASVNIQDIKEFTYEPPNPDDIFSVFEDVNFGEPNVREIEPCVAYSLASHASKIITVSPEVTTYNQGSIDKLNAYIYPNGDIEEDGSGWETVSHAEDQDSSYSLGGSDPSVNKLPRDSNVSGSGTEWEDHVGEETGITEISEVFSVPNKQLKKVSSISRLWKSYSSNGENYKIISVEGNSGRGLSNGRLSPDQGSGKGRISPQDLAGEWSSPDSGNPHITRGMKGCIEWPRGVQGSLKSKLLEARMESQKVQLRQVLKQKI